MQSRCHQRPKVAGTGIYEPHGLVVRQVAHLWGVHGCEGLDQRPRVIAADELTVMASMVQSRFQVRKDAVGGGPPAAHGLGIVLAGGPADGLTAAARRCL